MPKARTILPFVRLSFASSSAYSWWDENGQVHTVKKAEGGEQGDPLMLLHRHPGRSRRGCGHSGSGRATLRFLGRRLCFVAQSEDDLRRVGAVSFQGWQAFAFTSVWNKAGVPPDEIHSLGDEAGQPHGKVVLGTPLGNAQFVAEELRDI